MLEHYLRSADIIFSLMFTSGHRLPNVPEPAWTNKMASMLTAARHSLSLFQHHDGITGTAKDHVVIDYANKYNSITVIEQHLMNHSLQL